MQRYRVVTLFALFPPIFSRSSASEWKEEGKGIAKNAKILFPLSFPRTATWLSSPLFFLIVLPQCFKTSVEKKMVVYRVISDCSCCSVFEIINKLRFYTKLQLSVAETLQKPQFIFHPQKGCFQRHKTLLCNRFRIHFFWCEEFEFFWGEITSNATRS